MLLDAVIIVLRETLEAGVLVSVLLTIANQHQLGLRWLMLAFMGGLMGAVIYARNMGLVSSWFEYVGQEVLNGLIQYSIYLCLLFICLLVSSRLSIKSRVLMCLLTLTVALALIREATEIMIFFSGFIGNSDVLSKAVTSGFIGLMIGLSVGALCYFSIMSLKRRWIRPTQIVVLALVGAGMVAQATQLLIQADWLSSVAPLWDTRNILPEASIPGQLAYAIFGYEATPTPLEAWLFLGALLSIPLAIVLWRSVSNNNKSNSAVDQEIPQ
ncbi:MAG: hypothetical protein KUG71_11305 [Porticoccaceae bacterium]|nr:hypothetical protein [Porticoccaceae bacterium]